MIPIRDTFVFLMDLAYKSRVVLPVLTFCWLYLANVRLSMEFTAEQTYDGGEEADANLFDVIIMSDEEIEELSLYDEPDFDEYSLVSSHNPNFQRTTFHLDVDIDSW